MRVISGKYKGKNIIGFDIEGTRPTMDRIKESLFAIVQNIIKDSTCLDLFAGSGSLGIEAISNGAKSCYFVDSNKIAIEKIKNNIKCIQIKEEYHLINKNHLSALREFNEQNIKFDLIFLDPPYDLNLINNTLNVIFEYNLLTDNGYIVCEYENELVETNKFELIKFKKYGSKFIKIYKKSF